MNAGDNLAVPGDTIDERCAAQHREGPPCDFFHWSCLDVQLVDICSVGACSDIQLAMPITAGPIEQGVGRKNGVRGNQPRLAFRPAMTYLGLSPDHAATAQGLLDCYSETMWQGPTLRTNR